MFVLFNALKFHNIYFEKLRLKLKILQTVKNVHKASRVKSNLAFQTWRINALKKHIQIQKIGRWRGEKKLITNMQT